MKQIFIYLFALVAALVSCTPGHKQSAYDFSELDSLIGGWMEKGYYPGGAICVRSGDSLLFEKCYGDFTPQTPVYVASAGKWVAAAVVAAVVDRTELDWDDCVVDWLPEFDGDAKGEATLRQLLSHTSGIQPYLPEPRVDTYNRLDSAVAEILPLDTVFAPGRRFEYGGLAMQVAGRMAEVAMGKDFESIFQELLAQPVGMTRSHFVPVNRDGGHAPMLAGGLCTTLSDYIRFLDMIYHQGAIDGKQVLRPETVREMQADQVGSAEVSPGEYVEVALDKHHAGIYGLGEWRELVDAATGEAYQVSSPGWAGAYPWINKRDSVYGFFIAHVVGPSKREDGFSSFYGSPAISRTVTKIVGRQSHPRIYVGDSDKPAVREKIERCPWAKEAFQRLKDKIDPYAERHREDPEWLVSRLAMYWREGERYTQCYLRQQNWERGEGNAPVPTVRMPGMRTWNKYVNVPLAERIPYNATGDMWGVSRTDPTAPKVRVPYKESGHMVRANNAEILTLAEEASFLYWATGEEMYAAMAADVFNTWLLGTYYMAPILDPEGSCGSAGGWAPGGICGYYDYEQIHDELAMHAAVVYDFAYSYLTSHPHPHLAQIGKTLPEVAGTVFKRFIDIGFVRGGKSGNWNVNGWNMMLRPILALDDDYAYPDGKGRSYYLHYLTTESTPYHDAIPDIVKTYDPITGLWPESPGYSFGTISMLLEFSSLLIRQGIDILADNPIMQKAAFAVFPWMDERGNMIAFGDSRGGPANFRTFEHLLAYYARKGDDGNATTVAAALHKGLQSGVYRRETADWTGLCLFQAEIPAPEGEAVAERMSFSPHHRLVAMKSRPAERNLMAILYGGRNGYHLSPNGLALQLYGFGYALAPDASAYESYWSADHAYHQSATGSNTILPGYAEGNVAIRAMEPAIGPSCFVNAEALNPDINVCDMEAGEKRRTVALVKTAADRGYYVDIFRSNQEDNDYLMHNVGTALTLSDSLGRPLALAATGGFDGAYGKGYEWFDNLRRVAYAGDFKAVWQIASGSDPLAMRMWMTGARGRELYVMDAPYTTMQPGLTPGNVSMAPSATPTLLVRQSGNNALSAPFIAVFEPTQADASVTAVKALATSPSAVALCVASCGHRKDYIISNTVASKPLSLDGKASLCGTFGLVTVADDGVEQLYLVDGSSIAAGNVAIALANRGSASLYRKEGKWHYSATVNATLRIGSREYSITPAYNKAL